MIFASAFPGLEEFADEVARYTVDRMRRERARPRSSRCAPHARPRGTDDVALAEIDRRIHDLGRQLEDEPYEFDRRFLFRVLSMGHSQFAELIGARGPNTQVNAACASTTQAVALAEDWIRAGRCRRVVVVAADDVTSDALLGWLGAGFLASGAAATDEDVEEAALPFDRRRHGMILGMGAAALVVETRRGGARARHDADLRGARVGHRQQRLPRHPPRRRRTSAQVMEERRRPGRGPRRRPPRDRARDVFVSHETYTPARGGSAAAEIPPCAGLRRRADRVVIANTKGFTGHPMGVGIEDVVAVKALETGIVPPVPNFREPDPELGRAQPSHGGAYPMRYALRLAAGSARRSACCCCAGRRWPTAARRSPEELGYAYRVADRARGGLAAARSAATTPPSSRSSSAGCAWPTGSGRAPPPAVRARRRAAAPRSAPTPEPGGAPRQREPVPEPEPAAASRSRRAAVRRERGVAMVAEQTGYPPDMLDLDLDLEADLGIDTVKQAEVFATIREAYGIERDDTLKLRDYPTLNHVVGFVHERAPATDQAATPATRRAGRGARTADRSPRRRRRWRRSERVLALVAEQTGYPADMLDLDLDLEADLGIDTVKQAEVFATIREAYGIERDD